MVCDQSLTQQTQHAFPNIRPNIPISKHTPLHSTLKDQSQPSPRIQDHTVAAMGGRRTGEVGGEEEREEEIVPEKGSR